MAAAEAAADAAIEAERVAAEEAAAAIEAERVAAEEAAAAAERDRMAAELAAAEAPSTAASFADLSNIPIETQQPVDETEVVEDLAPERSPSPGPSVDTAALLRELASLGGFAEETAEATAKAATVKSAPVSKEADKKKKKGLFGGRVEVSP